MFLDISAHSYIFSKVIFQFKNIEEKCLISGIPNNSDILTTDACKGFIRKNSIDSGNKIKCTVCTYFIGNGPDEHLDDDALRYIDKYWYDLDVDYLQKNTYSITV